MLARFSQGLGAEMHFDYMNNLHNANLNFGVAERPNEPNLFGSLQPPFTTQYGGGLYNQPNMFDSRANNPLNLMTSVPVPRTQAPNFTVHTPKALLPASPAIPTTNDLKLNESPARDSLQMSFDHDSTGHDSNAAETEADTHFDFASYTPVIRHELEKWSQVRQTRQV